MNVPVLALLLFLWNNIVNCLHACVCEDLPFSYFGPETRHWKHDNTDAGGTYRLFSVGITIPPLAEKTEKKKADNRGFKKQQQTELR